MFASTIPENVRAVRASASGGGGGGCGCGGGDCGCGGGGGSATHVHFAGSSAAAAPVIRYEEASAAPALHAVATTAPDTSSNCARV